MAKITYILDTNVYLADPSAFKRFGRNDVVVPLKVLEEIDKHKKRQDGVGANARHAIRLLDEYRQKGSLQKGVRIDKGQGILKARFSDPSILPVESNKNDSDNIILACALSEQAEGKKVVVVSIDINLRVRCDALGIACEDYNVNQVVTDRSDLYTGITRHLVDDQIIDQFYAGIDMTIEKDERPDLLPNQFVMLISSSNEKKTALARFLAYNKPLIKAGNTKNGVWGIKPKNKEQAFAIDLLMDPDVPIVSLIGAAGCGKTLLAVAAGLEQVLEENGTEPRYKRLVVSRPVMPMGKDIGFLPGPQPLDAKILTPMGWTLMGKLKEGDNIISRDGKATKILKIFPKGKKLVYKVTTTDGSSTECCEDHLWLTKNANEKKHQKDGQIRTTKEILSSLKTKNNKINHFLPRVEPVEYESKELTIPAYTLGVLLGDGCLKNSISVCNTDLELIKRVEDEIADLGCTLTNNGKSIIYNIKAKLYNNKPARQVVLTDMSNNEVTTFQSIGRALECLDINRSTLQSRCDNRSIIDNIKYEFVDNMDRWQNPLKNELFKLNLDGKKSYEKFIPEKYLYSSINDRIALLQGLMDTDGCVKKSGETSFTTTSLQLAKDVQELVRSLGGRAIIKERNRIGKKTLVENREVITRRISYEFTVTLPQEINPFYISRKANRHFTKYIHSVGIESIEPVGEKEVQCILVDNPEHLYVTDEFIVTHNTLEEKMAPWLAPVQDNLQFLMGNDKVTLEMYMDRGIIEVEALTYIRGRSIANSFIIIDEAQNLSTHELKTIATRVGEGTKIILTGDIEQIDTVYLDATTNGLSYAVEKFKHYDLAGHITLQKGERSKVATLAAKVL